MCSRFALHSDIGTIRARFKLRGAGASSSARPKAPAAAVRPAKPEVKAPVKAVPAAPAAPPAAAGGVGEWTEF